MFHRFAIVENNKVINVFISEQNFVEIFYPNAILVDDNVCVGDSYVDGKFFRPKIIINEINEAEAL